MPLIRVQTKDPFAVTGICDWSDSNDVDTLDVSEPDASDVVTVTLYGIPETDVRFGKLAAFVKEYGDDGACPWTSAPPLVPSRLLVENVAQCWRAYPEGYASICYFGDNPAQACEMLCNDFEIPVWRLHPGDSGRDGLLLVLVRPEAVTCCPDCGGSGKYVGFSSVEPCRCCSGTGTI